MTENRIKASFTAVEFEYRDVGGFVIAMATIWIPKKFCSGRDSLQTDRIWAGRATKS
jgi:hypothetical protein